MSFAFTIIQTITKTPEKVWKPVIMGNIAHSYSSTPDPRDDECLTSAEARARAGADINRAFANPKFPLSYQTDAVTVWKNLWDRRWVDNNTLQILNYHDSLQDAQNWYLNYFSRPFVPYTSGYYDTSWQIVDGEGNQHPLPEITFEWRRSKEFVDPEFTPGLNPNLI